ncbi:hypothetical protein [Haloplanus sp. C73]|uniref:hypothetical protein n=1 Tax=Haloplanus sp. C73 TaxID=3421641 RepID=UPI003EB95CB4
MAQPSPDQGIDVIGIGAINYDYIVKVSKSLAEENIPESGDEDLSRFTAEDLATPISKYYHSRGFTDTQIGGSSYLAVKTISYLQDLNLNTAYVGIYSTPGELERDVDFFTNVSDVDQRAREEFDHLDDDEWLFEVDGTPGRGLLELSSGKRQKARVGPGVNTRLVEHIREKEAAMETDGDTNPFTEYLASAQWVHLTSFADFDQFQFFVDRLKDAKKLNPHLRVSIDPGYEYTYRHTSYDSAAPSQADGNRLSLDDAFEVTDYVFMNTAELTNLSDSDTFEVKRDADTLASLSETDELQAIIIKEENRHSLINFVNNVPYYQEVNDVVLTEYWHRKLGRFDIKNDTGTGDALAGGVIAGILSPTTLSYKPVPVEIGSSLASEVLQSYDFPAKNMNNVARTVISKKQKQANPTDGLEKKINAIRANHGERIEGLVIGIIASGLVYLITVLV